MDFEFESNTKDLNIESTVVNEKTVFECSFSSEANTAPRQDKKSGKIYLEVLPHDSDSIDFSKMIDGNWLPLLDNHDRSKRIGKVSNIHLDPVNKQLRGTVEFASNDLAKQVVTDVNKNDYTTMSFGYKTYPALTEFKKINGIEYGIAKKWTPFEVSMVPVAEDTTVGIGKSFSDAIQIVSEEEELKEEVKSMDETVNKTELNNTEETNNINTNIESTLETKELNTSESVSKEVTEVIEETKQLIIEKDNSKMENEKVNLPAAIDFGKDNILNSYSIQEHIKGYMTGTLTGAAKEIAQELGQSNVIPVEAFKAFTTDNSGGANTGGQFNIPKFGGYLDLLLPQSVFGKLGCQTMNLNSSIVLPGADTPVPTAISNESTGAGGATGDPSTRSITFDAKVAVAQIALSKKSLFQSEAGIDAYLMNTMLRRHRSAFEAAALSQLVGEITNSVTIGATNVVDDATSATLLNIMKAVASVIDLPAKGTFLTNWDMYTKLQSIKRSATLTLPVVQNGLIWDMPTVVSALLAKVATKDPVIYLDPEQVLLANFGPGVAFEVDSSSQANALKAQVTITSQCFWDAHLMDTKAAAKAVNAT